LIRVFYFHRFFFSFFLDKKKKRKNQGKHDASGRFAAHATGPECYKLNQQEIKTVFQELLWSFSSRLLLEWHFIFFARSKSKNTMVAVASVKFKRGYPLNLKQLLLLLTDCA